MILRKCIRLTQQWKQYFGERRFFYGEWRKNMSIYYAFLRGELKNGRYGFPNNFVEKEFGVLSTTRNWNTITKMVSSEG